MNFLGRGVLSNFLSEKGAVGQINLGTYNMDYSEIIDRDTCYRAACDNIAKVSYNDLWSFCPVTVIMS